MDQPPIGRLGDPRFLSQGTWTFVRLKAPLVLMMLDKRMLKAGSSLGLNRVVPKIILSAMNGDLGLANAIGTQWFLRVCRKVSGIDFKTFQSQWIYPLLLAWSNDIAWVICLTRHAL